MREIFHFKLQFKVAGYKTSMDKTSKYGTNQDVTKDIFQPVENQSLNRHFGPDARPKDYFWLAFFVTLCCCPALGTVAIVRSSEVRLRFGMGDHDGSNQASKQAKTWSLIGLTIGLCGLVLLVILEVSTINSLTNYGLGSLNAESSFN